MHCGPGISYGLCYIFPNIYSVDRMFVNIILRLRSPGDNIKTIFKIDNLKLKKNTNKRLGRSPWFKIKGSTECKYLFKVNNKAEWHRSLLNLNRHLIYKSFQGNRLTHISPGFHFYIPWKCQKWKVFWCFQGYRNGTLGFNGLMQTTTRE